MAEAAEMPIKVAVAWTPESLEALAHQKAKEAHLSSVMEKRFVETLRSESWGFTVVDGQSQVPSKGGPNGLEDSWGTCQIHLPSHTEVSKEMAQDPVRCMEWSAKQFKEGNASMWTEYRKLVS